MLFLLMWGDYMIENIADGIITGFGIVSGAASIASYVSGFSLEKDIDKIKKSLKTLEDIKTDINKQNDKESILLNSISNNIDVFYHNNTKHQKEVLNSILNLYEQQKKQMDRQSRIILESVNEMREIISSIRFNTGSPVNVNTNFVRNLMNDPFEMGVHEFSKFDYDLFESKDNFITPSISPIIWNDTYGNKFFGKISKNVMNKYGLNIKSGIYAAQYDGYTFSSKYGMYLPNISII